MSPLASRKADRELLLALADALQVSKSNLRRDPCGDWNIFGRRGHISTDGIATHIYLQPGTKRRWEKAKRSLGFLTVTQDGDDEGTMKMVDLPTAGQAGLVRKLVGMRKAPPLSEERRAALSLNFSPKSGVSAGSSAVPNPGHCLLPVTATAACRTLDKAGGKT